MKLLNVALLLVSCFGAIQSSAQVFTPVKWETSYEKTGDNEYNLIFTASIENNWWTYSQFIDEGGPVPTAFEFDPGDHFELIGKTSEEGDAVEKPEPLFDNMVLKKFLPPTATFTQKIRLTDPSKAITGYYTFMACDKSKCLPPKDTDFEFSIVASSKPSNNEAPKTTSGNDEARAQVKSNADNKMAGKSKPEDVTQKVNSTPASKKPAIASTSNDQTKTKPQKEKISKELVPDQSVLDLDDKILEPVKWQIKIDPKGKDLFDINFVAQIEEEWTVYSMSTAEDGPIPTEITVTPSENIEVLNKAENGNLKEGPDPYFDNVIVKKFLAPTATFTQTVNIKDTKQPLDGYLTFMACDKTQCLPPADIDFWIDFSKNKAVMGPEALALIEGGTNLSGGNGVSTVPNLSGNVIDQVIPSIRQTYVSPIGDCGEEDNAKGQNLFWTFIFGFGGGLLALLTPCVFPMIPLTVSFFTKDTKRKGWVNGLIYGLSIIVIYVAIGLLITGFFGATALNALSTNWIANVGFFLIFVFFAFSFFGYYEITLPSSWTTKSDSMADKGGLIGIFFMAFTLALVSFSCTGPIIGTALVQSATDPIGPFVVMLGFSTALALPFGLFAAFPAFLNTLPQSGGWMNSVKVVLGFLELALALKFLSVADMTMNWGILGYEIFMGLWFLLFAGMTAYLFGWIKFPHDSPKTKMTIPRWAFAIGSLALTVYLATGFLTSDKTQSYNALGLMSGLAPPAHYNYLLPEPEVNPEIKARFASFSKCANGLDCFKDYYEGLTYAKENKLPVFLDFTGHGCVNCRKTEEHIWVKDKIRNKLQNEFVLISLYVDERKKLNEILISKSRQEKLRNVGNKWADFQIVNFEQNSQPLYVMMTPDEKVLASPRGYKEGVNSYSEFMDCGLATYQSYKKTGSL